MDMAKFSIKPEAQADADGIFDVHAACFPTRGEAELVDRLRSGGRLAVSLVARHDGRIVGHVAFSPVTAAGATGGIGLAPVAVLDTFRRRGIAAQLVEKGLKTCRERGYGWCVVLGDPAYYERFGFEPASAADLSDAYGGGEAFQVVELIEGQLPAGAGLVRYAPEFDALE